MTTYPHTRAQDPPIARAGRVPSPVAPSTGDLAFGLIDAFSGAGLAFMSFLAAVPGLLPAVILTVLLIAPLCVLLLVVGAAAGLVLGILRVAAWALAFAASRVGRVPRARLSVSRPPHNTHAPVPPLVHTGL